MKEDLQKAVGAFKETSFCPAGAEYDESCGLFKVDGVFDMMTQRFWEAYNLGRHMGLDGDADDVKNLDEILFGELDEKFVMDAVASFNCYKI